MLTLRSRLAKEAMLTCPMENQQLGCSTCLLELELIVHKDLSKDQ